MMKQIINKVAVTLQNNSQIIKTVCCFVFIIFVMVTNVHAEPSDPGTVDPDAVPIDGGLSLLVAAGVGYGAKKMKERRKQAAK